MKKIGILSDTHGFIDDKIIHFFADCDEIWHAGDIGNVEIFKKIKNNVILAVIGNIDSKSLKYDYPEFHFFKCENHKILIIHIAFQYGKFTKYTENLIKEYSPTILICGHSHILKVYFDNNQNLLIINPGASGNQGFHAVKTAIRLDIDNDNISNLEILELPRS